MQFGPIAEADSPATTNRQFSLREGRGRTNFSQAADPSLYFLVDPPKRHTRFRSWFALAVFAGILMALGIVALLNSL
jgi:hypothetical protein